MAAAVMDHSVSLAFNTGEDDYILQPVPDYIVSEARAPQASLMSKFVRVSSAKQDL